MTVHVIETSLLRVGYEVAGPDHGFAVILVHGWPDDVRTWDAVQPAPHEAGYRTYVPWLRGYGATEFLRPDTERSDQLVALGQEVAEAAKREAVLQAQVQAADDARRRAGDGVQTARRGTPAG